MYWRKDPHDLSIITDNLRYPPRHEIVPYYPDEHPDEHAGRSLRLGTAVLIGTVLAAPFAPDIIRGAEPAFSHSFVDYTGPDGSEQPVPPSSQPHP